VRTTLTLDDDVAAKLRAEVRRSGKPFKEVLNQALRAGLTPCARQKKPPPFKIKTFAMGLRPGLNLDDVWGLIEQVEGPFHR
jgi:Ribbon-helix-helix protein, copG family